MGRAGGPERRGRRPRGRDRRGAGADVHAAGTALLGVRRFHGRIGETDPFTLDSAGLQGSGARGVVDEARIERLDDELAGVEDAVVSVHHSLGYRHMGDNYWFGDHPERAFCWTKAEVNDVLERHDVLAVVNGHVHETAYTRHRGVDHVTVNAFNGEFRNAPVTGTYAELVVDDGFEIRIVEGDRTTRTFAVP